MSIILSSGHGLPKLHQGSLKRSFSAPIFTQFSSSIQNQPDHKRASFKHTRSVVLRTGSYLEQMIQSPQITASDQQRFLNMVCLRPKHGVKMLYDLCVKTADNPEYAQKLACFQNEFRSSPLFQEFLKSILPALETKYCPDHLDVFLQWFVSKEACTGESQHLRGLFCEDALYLLHFVSKHIEKRLIKDHRVDNEMCCLRRVIYGAESDLKIRKRDVWLQVPKRKFPNFLLLFYEFSVPAFNKITIEKKAHLLKKLEKLGVTFDGNFIPVTTDGSALTLKQKCTLVRFFVCTVCGGGYGIPKQPDLKFLACLLPDPSDKTGKNSRYKQELYNTFNEVLNFLTTNSLNPDHESAERLTTDLISLCDFVIEDPAMHEGFTTDRPERLAKAIFAAERLGVIEWKNLEKNALTWKQQKALLELFLCWTGTFGYEEKGEFASQAFLEFLIPQGADTAQYKAAFAGIISELVTFLNLSRNPKDQKTAEEIKNVLKQNAFDTPVVKFKPQKQGLISRPIDFFDVLSHSSNFKKWLKSSPYGWYEQYFSYIFTNIQFFSPNYKEDLLVFLQITIQNSFEERNTKKLYKMRNMADRFHPDLQEKMLEALSELIGKKPKNFQDGIDVIITKIDRLQDVRHNNRKRQFLVESSLNTQTSSMILRPETLPAGETDFFNKRFTELQTILTQYGYSLKNTGELTYSAAAYDRFDAVAWFFELIDLCASSKKLIHHRIAIEALIEAWEITNHSGKKDVADKLQHLFEIWLQTQNEEAKTFFKARYEDFLTQNETIKVLFFNIFPRK